MCFNKEAPIQIYRQKSNQRKTTTTTKINNKKTTTKKQKKNEQTENDLNKYNSTAT